MQHLDEGTIHAWLDGALSPEEATRANAHVEGCPQCQAAVAEARGFIAASSRILTALDDAPRGVIPMAPKRRVQPWVWRVAATVLVVATGTVLLVKERGSESRSAMSSTVDSAAGSAELAPVTVLSRSATAADSTAGSRATAQSAPAQPATAPAIRTAAPVGAVSGVTPPPVRAMSKQDLRLNNDEAQASAGARRLDAATGAKSNVVEPAAAARVPTAAAAPTPLRQAFGTIAGGATETVPREVGTKHLLGRTQTLYEIAPGDTVMLEEQLPVQLQSAVVTAAAGQSRQTQPTQRTEKSAAAAASVESQQKVEATPAPAPAAALQDAQIADRHSISWLDPSTRQVIVLSGRHSQEELERIREQIQRLRAVQPKRNPE